MPLLTLAYGKSRFTQACSFFACCFLLRSRNEHGTHRADLLALELECLIMDTKDNAVVSKWWDSAFEAMEEYHKLKPGAAEDAEIWAKIRKAGI